MFKKLVLSPIALLAMIPIVASVGSVAKFENQMQPL